MYYLTMLSYDIVNFFSRFIQGFSAKCNNCNILCMDSHLILFGTNTVRIVTDTPHNINIIVV